LNNRYFNLLIFTIGVIVAVFSWDLISIPLSSEKLLNKFESLKFVNNVYNDQIRFIIFLSIPIISLVTYLQLIEKKFFKNLNNVLIIEKFSYLSRDYTKINAFTILIFFILSVEFLSLNFADFNHHLDIFHEGMWLSASQNLKLTGEYWGSSYIVRGFFGDFYPFFLWEVIGKESVGVTRLFNLLIFFLNKLLLILIARKISLFSNFEKNKMILFFLCLSLLLMSLQGYINPIFQLRTFLFLIFILFILNFFDSYDKNSFFVFFLGLFSSLSFFWYIDIGLYINLILLVFALFFILRFEYKNFIFLVFSVFIGWFIIYLYFPKQEIYNFFDNTYSILTTLHWLYGIEFPTPFLSYDARSGKSILIFLLTSYMIVDLINNHKTENSKFIIVMIFLFIISLTYFNYALGRSDSGHIRNGSGILFIPFFSILLFKSFNFLKFSSIKSGAMYNYINFGLIGLIFISLVLFNKKYENKNFTNIPSFQNSISQLINYSDYEFLDKDFIDFMNYYKNLIKNEKCVSIFTNEVAFYYFLKKPSCSKYYFMFSAPPIKIQKKIIEDFSIKKPKYIIYNSDKDLFYNSQIRLKNLNRFIKNNYIFFKKINGWEIYKII
jgi:hypothetical protein